MKRFEKALNSFFHFSEGLARTATMAPRAQKIWQTRYTGLINREVKTMDELRAELAKLGVVVQQVVTKSMGMAPLKEMELKKKIAAEREAEREAQRKKEGIEWYKALGGTPFEKNRDWKKAEKLSGKSTKGNLAETTLGMAQMKNLGSQLTGTTWELLWNGVGVPMEAAVDVFKNTAAMMIEPIKHPMKVMKKGKKVVGDFLGGLMSAVGPMSLVAVGVQMVSQMAMQLIDALNPFQPLFDAVVAIFTVFGDVMRAQMMPVVGELFEIMLSEEVIEAFTVLGGVFAELMKALMPIVRVFINALVPLVTGFAPLLRLLVIPLRIFAAIIELLSPAIQMLTIPMQIFGGIAEALSPLIFILVSALDKLGELARGASNVISGLGGWISYGFDVIRWRFMQFIDKLDFLNLLDIDVGPAPERPGGGGEGGGGGGGPSDWSGRPEWGSTAGFAKHVPMMATGGFVTRTGLAVVHAGEVVVPAGNHENEGVVVQININGDIYGIDDLNSHIIRVVNDEVVPTLLSRRR